MLNETEILNVNDTSMDDLKNLVNNIINTPLNDNFEKHIDDLKWNVENAKEKIKENISISNNTKKELKTLIEESVDSFEAVKESIEDHSKSIVRSVSERVNHIENILKVSEQKTTQLAKDYKEDYDKKLENMKNELHKSLLHIDTKFDDIEIFLRDQSGNTTNKFELMKKQLNESSDELKKLSLQFDTQRQENSKLQIGLIIVSIVNLVLIAILNYINFQS
ncbi:MULTISPECIES: hypothetical protein [Acinetobacter]|uniref:hypothetical protein n=1 Tax=Acinetobacter TaxID=469 RepID=UPI000EA0AB34|nr:MULTISPECIES: hypothetical protein [Acinetobacter]RKG39413.1 hypothetical protein D7V51_15990 [Acinetobacter cumulans]RZG56270.1 hypothetical protein EXE29_16010 [Acinetobacter sp. WCHAc060006]